MPKQRDSPGALLDARYPEVITFGSEGSPAGESVADIGEWGKH